MALDRHGVEICAPVMCPTCGERVASRPDGSPRNHGVMVNSMYPRLGVTSCPGGRRKDAPSLCTDACASHPEHGTHECLATEMRCAYCGVRLAPYPCNGCGKFLTAKQMNDGANGESWRCEECA